MAIAEELVSSRVGLSDLYSLLRKKRLFHGSIQALFKLLKKMVGEGILAKDRKSYSLSKAWVVRNKRFFDRLFDRKSRLESSAPMLSQDYEEYSFDSLFSLDNFWYDAIYRIAKGSAKKKIFIRNSYYWWIILNLNYELLTLSDHKRRGFDIHILLTKDNKLNRWALKVLEEHGFRASIEGDEDDSQIDWNVFDDTLIQVNYDRKTAAAIKRIFGRYKFVEEIPPKELAKLTAGKGKFLLRIIRNRPLAEQMKKGFEKP